MPIYFHAITVHVCRKALASAFTKTHVQYVSKIGAILSKINTTIYILNRMLQDWCDNAQQCGTYIYVTHKVSIRTIRGFRVDPRFRGTMQGSLPAHAIHGLRLRKSYCARGDQSEGCVQRRGCG